MPELNLTARRLRQCRKETQETLEQIARLVSVNKSTVMRWERGDTARINLPTLYRLAQHYRVDPQWLLGATDEPGDGLRETVPPDVVPVPVIGSVRAGCGGIVMEEPMGSEPVERSALHGDDAYFWLSVSGDSMTPLINDRDLVLVRRQDSVDSGRYAVVRVNGEEGLVKRVVYGADWIELQSVNPYYPPRRFEGAQVTQVTVVGLVVESKRKYV